MEYFYCNGKKGVCTQPRGNRDCCHCQFVDGSGGKYISNLDEIICGIPKEENPYEENPYWERITALAERQRKKGMSKYGSGLENNPADILERINHLQEELIDALMYCEWIKEIINAQA